jgi:hypothetical protein
MTREKLLLYLEGTLPPKEMKILNAHIGSCPDCQKHILEVESLSGKIGIHFANKADSYVPPSLLWGKILSRIQTEKANSKKKSPVWGKVAIGITASVVLLLVSTFAPVFGSEGNLLNVISSGIINNAANEMTAMFTDDLTGQVLSAVTESQLKSNLGVSEADINYLKQNGFSTKDVILAATISAKSGKSVEEIALMRKDNWGWGRIANSSGISVLSVGNQVGTPINETTQKVKNTDDFSIDLDIASTGSQVVITDFRETLTLPTGIPITDEFGNTVTADQATSTGHARMRFRIKDGKAEPVSIEARHTLPDKFVFKGKVKFINGNSIVIIVDDSEKTVSISDALTFIDGEVSSGDFVRVQGVVVREKMVAKYIRVIPGNTSADIGKPADDNKTPDTGKDNDTKPSDTSDTKKDEPKKDEPKTGNNNDGKILGPQNPVNAKLSGYDSGYLSTNIGKFKLTRDTKVLLKIKSLTPYTINPNAIQAIKIGANIKITKNENGDVTEIFINSDDCKSTAGYIFKVDPRHNLLTVITRDGQRFTTDDLIFQNYTRVQNKAGKVIELSALKPGDSLTYIENGNGVLLLIRFDSMNPFNKIGVVKEINDDSVTIFNESETLTFKTFPKTEWRQEIPNKPSISIPKEAIQKGTPVQIFGINIGNNYIAYIVTQKPPPPPMRPQGEKMFQFISISKTEGTDDYELKLINVENEEEVVVLVRIGVTKILLPIGKGQFKPGKIEDLKKGIMVSFFIKDHSSKLADRITIHPKQQP